jgi:transposase
MEQHAGIDVSLEWSSVCIVDASGKIVRETKVASEPEVLVEFFKGLSFPVMRIGLEAGPLSQWLHAGLARAGFETVLLETRELSAGQAMLERITMAMLESRAALWREAEQLHREMLRIVRDDEICRRLMSIPGVGPLVAITFKSAIDDPGRIAKSKTIGALFGLVPRNTNPGRGMLAAALLEPGTNQYAQRCMKRPMWCSHARHGSRA